MTAAPKAEAQPFGDALWIDYQNTWLAAQQNTSPSVIGVDGKYSYQRAPEDWQAFYQTHGVVYADVLVVLLDPPPTDSRPYGCAIPRCGKAGSWGCRGC